MVLVLVIFWFCVFLDVFLCVFFCMCLLVFGWFLILKRLQFSSRNASLGMCAVFEYYKVIFLG